MARINAETGRLFAPEDELLDLAQAVEDALLTVRGERRYRPFYGSYVTEFGVGVELVIPSIYDALRHVQGVRTIEVLHSGPTLRIIINDAMIVDTGMLRSDTIITWLGEGVTWQGEEIRWGS